MSTGEPKRITHLSLNLTPEVGANDALLGIRIVPDGRDGNTVFARTLRPGEADDGTPVVLDSSAGERFRFRQGFIVVSIEQIDRQSRTGPDGYSPITNTIWTWLHIASGAQPDEYRYLLAASRRLDGSHAILTLVKSTLNEISGGFIRQRERIYLAYSLAELLIVALGRAVDMVLGLRDNFTVQSTVPVDLVRKQASIRAMRNAFEHIEDRALGRVHGKPHSDALSVFDQRRFLSDGVLRYGDYSLSVETDVPQILLSARQHIYDVAVEICGATRVSTESIVFFAPPENDAGSECG